MRKYLLFSCFFALFFSGAGYYLFSRDWPRLYLASFLACGFNQNCVINIANLYGGNWDEMVWLPLYNRELKGVENDEDEGLCERMFFLKSSRIEFSYHSACLDFPSKREKRFSFNSESALKIRKDSPFLCVKRNTNDDKNFLRLLPNYSIEKCKKTSETGPDSF